MALVRWVDRTIGLDVHLGFSVVAICEDGKVRSAGRVPGTPQGLRLLAESVLAIGSGRVGGDGELLGGRANLEPFVDRSGACSNAARITRTNVRR